MTETLTGQIVTLEFEDGAERDPYCGLEYCECPEHELPAPQAGVYITIRLDDPAPVGMWKVQIIRQDSAP